MHNSEAVSSLNALSSAHDLPRIQTAERCTSKPTQDHHSRFHPRDRDRHGGLLEDDFGWLDSAYQSVITISTVGFSEVKPLSDASRTFTIVLILLGV
jgi:hypothetical protein